jgi:hypothetical protein
MGKRWDQGEDVGEMEEEDEKWKKMNRIEEERKKEGNWRGEREHLL